MRRCYYGVFYVFSLQFIAELSKTNTVEISKCFTRFRRYMMIKRVESKVVNSTVLSGRPVRGSRGNAGSSSAAVSKSGKKTFKQIYNELLPEESEKLEQAVVGSNNARSSGAARRFAKYFELDILPIGLIVDILM